MFKGRSQVQIRRSGFTQDEIGGNVETLLAVWTKWADVENRSGFNTLAGGRDSWQYDYRITIRYEVSRPTQSNDTVIYNGQRMKVNSVSRDSEGTLMFEVLRCSVIDNNVSTTAPVINMLPQILNITGTGASSYQDDLLIGAYIDQVSVDGVEFKKVISTSFTTDSKEFYVNPATGLLSLSDEVPTGVIVIVHYYAY